MNHQRLWCLYDFGAVGPVDIVRSLAGTFDLSVVGSSISNEVGNFFRECGVQVFTSIDAATAASPAPHGVFTFSESCIIECATLCELYDLPGISTDSAIALRDKAIQRDALAGAQVDSTTHLRCENAQDLHRAARSIGFPAIVKPARGFGSKGTVLLTSTSDVTDAASRWDWDTSGGLVIEEYLVGKQTLPAGDYVSVEVAVSAGDCSVIAVTGKLPLVSPFREPGQFWPSTLAASELNDVSLLACRSVRALQAQWGLFHVEIKLCSEGPRLIEVNGRLGGFIHELLRTGLGLDMVNLAARLALGEPLSLDTSATTAAADHANGVVFQTSNLAPAGAARFLGTHNVADIRRHPQVEFYRTLIGPEQHLEKGVGTQELDLLQGRAADHASMFSLIDSMREHMMLDFELGSGQTISCSANSVHEANLTMQHLATATQLTPRTAHVPQTAQHIPDVIPSGASTPVPNDRRKKADQC